MPSVSASRLCKLVCRFRPQIPAGRMGIPEDLPRPQILRAEESETALAGIAHGFEAELI